MSVHIDVLETNLEPETPQRSGSEERTPPDAATLSPQDVVHLIEQRAARNLRMRAH